MSHRLGSWTPPDDSDTVLAVRGVHATHDARSGSADVLDCVNATLGVGVRTAVLGANGSGKTTLLRVLSGGLRPRAGTVISAGMPLRYDRRGLTGHRQRVQLVLQDPDDQLLGGDVRCDVGYGPSNLGLGEVAVADRVAESLEVLGISALADRPVHRLSFGQRKRVAIAGALAMRPAVLLLDEPTAGLDPAGVGEMLEALTMLEAHGTTVVLSTHDVDLAWSWAQEVLLVVDGVVHQGGVVDALTAFDILAAARLQPPWPVALAARFGLAIDSLCPPRTLDDIAAFLGPRAESDARLTMTKK